MKQTTKARTAGISEPQKGCPKLAGFFRVSADDQTTALQSDDMEKTKPYGTFEEHLKSATG